MEQKDLLYEGKAKKMYHTSDEQVIWVEYLDQATALNGLMKDQVNGKGELNNQITSKVFHYLSEQGIANHFINDEHVLFLQIADEAEITELKTQARKINHLLIQLFEKIDLQLIDFKLEFGKTATGEIVLGDEISPDTCRLWDLKTNEHMDKDVYRRKIGEIVPVYQEVLTRLTQVGL